MSFYECKNIASHGGNLTKSGNSEITIIEGVTPSDTNYATIYIDAVPDIAIFYKNDPNRTPQTGYCVWEIAKSKIYKGIYSGGILGCNYISNADRTKFALSEFANTQYCSVAGVYSVGGEQPYYITFKIDDRIGWNYMLIYF